MENARYSKCREYMIEEGYAATVAVSPENTLYFTGCYLMTQTNLRLRLAMALMPVDSDPVMIACKVEAGSVEAETWIQDKRYYVEFHRSPMELLADALKEKGLEGKKIGIELDYLMSTYYIELKKLMPTTEFVVCTRLFEKVRMIKDEAEIKLLGDAAKHTSKAFAAACAMTAPGETELVLGHRIVTNMLTRADKMDFLCLCSGTRTMEVHGEPADHILQCGEIGRIDFGGQYKHYLTDLARTFGIGKVKPEYIDMYNRFIDAYVETYQKIAPGVAACEIRAESVKQFERCGLPHEVHLVGHGLGMGAHELPILNTTEPQILLPGMVLCYEISVTLHGRKMHHEETLCIRENGVELLSAEKMDPKMIMIE